MYRSVEINVMSATGLKKVNFITKMDVYAVVYIEGAGDGDKQKHKTPANKNGHTNPFWNYAMKFTVDEVAARRNGHTLVFRLRSQRALGDRDIGEVHVPVTELLDSPAATDGLRQYLNYQVMKPNGKAKGQLSFSYKFWDKSAGPSATVYPPHSTNPPAMSSTSYPIKVTYAAAPSTPPIAAGNEAAYPAAMGYYFQGASMQGAVHPPPPQGQYGDVCPPPPLFGGYPPPPPADVYGYASTTKYGYPVI